MSTDNPNKTLSHVEAGTASTAWSAMSASVRKADEAKIKDFKDDIDTLLVLAGLLSAVTASFLVESYKGLQPEPSDLTNQLLAQIFAQLNGTPPPVTAGFQSPSWAIQVNVLWIASLVFSIMTASLGILVKQWLKEFLAANDVATSPQAQLRIRFFRYPGLRNWKVFEFVAVLPMLLQLALGLFLLGLCFFTSAVHPSIRNTSVPLVSLWAIIFLLVTLAPAFSPQCPYKTSFLKSAMRSLRIHFSKWSSFRSLYASSTKSVDDLRVRGNLPKRAQDDILPLPDTDSGWVDGSIHIELGPLVSGNQESVRSDTSSFEEEDAAMNDEADLEILLESFVGTDSAPSDVIAFILRVIRNQLQKSIDVNRVSTILDLRRLSFEVWSVIIRTATGILKREVDAQLSKDRDTVEWNDWMGDSMALLISLTSYPLPAESHQLLSKLLIVDPLSVITFISSRLPPQFVPSDHIHLLRSLRSVVSALPSRERGHHISKLLRQRTFPDITEEQRSWAQYVQRYLVESSAAEVGFPLLHAYHELEPPASHTMSLLVRLLKCQFKLKDHPPSKLNVIMNLRTLPANDWSAAVKVASAVILSSIDKKAINEREMEASHSIMNALLVLLSYSKHPMPYEGLKALSKLLMISTEACMDILPTKVRDNSTLDHVVLRLSTALHIVSDNMQALHVTSFLWSRHQGFKRYSVSEVDDVVKTGLTARLMESLLRSSASDILPLFIRETRRTNRYSSDTMQFTYKLLSHVLQIPFSESGENPILDLSALNVEIWRALMIMLVGLLQTKIPQSSSQGLPYPTWVQDALTLLISTYKEPLPDECQDWLRRFLHDIDDSATLVANIAFPKTSEAGRFAAVYRNLQPTLELLPIESMLTYISSILSNRFCQCSVKDQKHDTTLIELLNAHAADITSDAFDTIAEHLMAIVDTSLCSTVPVVPSAQVAVSVLLSPQFAVAASSGLVATRRTWIADQLVNSSRTHILLHVISANHGLGRPQMTTIVHIILEIIINGTWRMTLPVLSRALGEHTIRCDMSSPLDPFMICDFLAELCEAHVLYHLTHNPDTEIRDVLRRWKNVWLNLAVAFEAFPSMGHNAHDTSQISKCLDRLQQLQSVTKMSIEERTQSHDVASSSDFLVPFFLILALQKAARVLSPSDDTNIGFSRGSVLNKTRRSMDIEAMATRDMLDSNNPGINSGSMPPIVLHIQGANGEPLTSDPTSESVDGTSQGGMLRPSQTEEQFDTNLLLARPPVILSRENSSSTLSGSFVTARNELPPYIPESVLYHAGEISRSESSLGLSGLEVDTHHVYPVSTELNDSSPNWGTPQGSPAPSIWYPPAEVLPDD